MIKGYYKHFKGGIYKVIGIGEHSETGEDMAIYISISDNKTYLKPLHMFSSKVDKVNYSNTNQEYRFQFIGDIFQ